MKNIIFFKDVYIRLLVDLIQVTVKTTALRWIRIHISCTETNPLAHPYVTRCTAKVTGGPVVYGKMQTNGYNKFRDRY